MKLLPRFSAYLFIMGIAIAALLPATAQAQHWDNGHGRYYDREHHYQSRYPDRSVYEVQPRIVTRYVVSPPVIYYQTPAYARRPVYWRERYAVGGPVVHVNPVPFYVARQLQPAPRGYFYCMGDADRDVYLVSAVDNIIVQVIALAVR